jgi:hypothetical protein
MCRWRRRRVKSYLGIPPSREVTDIVGLADPGRRRHAFQIDVEFAEIVDAVLADYGRWPAGQLRDLTYQTPPMQEAVKQHRHEVRLDLAGGSPLPDLGSGLARLRRWAKSNPLPADEPGGIGDLIEEVDQLTEHRADATRHLLGEWCRTPYLAGGVYLVVTSAAGHDVSASDPGPCRSGSR